MSLAKRLRAAVRDELPAAVALRHRLHRDPRVSGDERDTADEVAAALGFGAGTVVARTGRLIAVPAGGDGAAVALRAELDALPVKEESEVPWRSVNGVMHACGHDVHAAALVALCRAAARVGDLPLPLLALLQPREEGADSGARDVVESGALAGTADVVAAHVQPQLEAGWVAATPGAVNAGNDEVYVEVSGRGGHAGYPHTVDDTVLCLASLVVALQQVSSRRIDPVAGAVMMVNQIQAGSAANVAPGRATAVGSLRTMRDADRLAARNAVEGIAAGVAAAHGCEIAVTFKECEPTLHNNPELAAAAFGELLDMGHHPTTEFRSFGSDDFAHYCRQQRGLMLFVGTGSDGGGLHESTFVPADDYVIVVADALLAGYLAAVDCR